MEAEEFETHERNIVSELIRKLAVAGWGAADKTKEELTRLIGEEIRQFLHSELAREGVAKLLAGMKLEVKAEIQLIPKDPPPPEEGREAKKPTRRRRG